MKNKIKVLSILLSALIFASCSHISSSSGSVVLKGEKVIVRGQVSMNLNRMAYCEVDNYYIKVFAQEENNLVDEPIVADVTDNTFSIELETGKKWNLTAELYKEVELTTLLLFGSADFDLTSDEIPDAPVITANQFANGQGSVNLSLGVDSNNFTKCIITYKNRVGSATAKNQTVYFSSGLDNRFFTASSLDAGLYDFSMVFYKKDINNNENAVFAYDDVFYILKAQKTESWNNKGDEYFSGNKLYITEDLVKQYSSNYIYVSEAGDDSSFGNSKQPFNSIQKAVDYINTINDGKSTYTIVLLSDIDSKNYSISNGALASIDNKGKSLKLRIDGKNKTISGESGTACFSIASTDSKLLNCDILNIVLQDFVSINNGGGIKVSNSNTKLNLNNVSIKLSMAVNGGGLYIGDGATCTLNSGSKIEDCFDVYNGSSIFVEENGILNIKDVNLSNMFSDFSKNSVYIEGIVNIYGGSFSSNGRLFQISGDAGKLNIYNDFEYSSDSLIYFEKPNPVILCGSVNPFAENSIKVDFDSDNVSAGDTLLKGSAKYSLGNNSKDKDSFIFPESTYYELKIDSAGNTGSLYNPSVEGSTGITDTLSDVVEFYLSESNPVFSQTTGTKNISVSAKINGTKIVQNPYSDSEFSDFEIKVFYNSYDTDAVVNGNNVQIDLSWPVGTYIIYVSARRNGITYSDSIVIKIE